MRRRATIITDASTPLDPADAKITDRSFSHPGIKGAREERLTFAFDELPVEWIDVLKQSRELHIRWTSGISYKTPTPFVSRSIPGLHVHYTPSQQHSDDLLCQTLRSIFSKELKCNSVRSAFTQPTLISERFTSSTSSQYFSPLQRLAQLTAYVHRKICSPSDMKCIRTASLLATVDYLDIDYDSISHTLVVTAFWSRPPKSQMDAVTHAITKNSWPLEITARVNDKVEIGFLTSSEATDAHDIQMEGLLTELGKDEALKPVLFSFPSRHHSLPPAQSSVQTFNVSFIEPTGLHPILNIKFPSAQALVEPQSKPEDSTCALHAYFTLPSAIFADQYAFPTTASDPLFEAAHHIKFLRSISGELDLEAPDYVIDKWGSAILLELSTPVDSAPSKGMSSQDSWTISVPLHLRYLPPSQAQSHAPVSVPWPALFWACTAEDGTKFPVNPFDRIHLGYDTLFGPRTMFYHLDGSRHQPLDTKGPATSLIETINVPVLDTRKVGGDHVVQWGTLVVVVLGFAWVVSKLWPAVAVLLSSDDVSGETSKSTKKKQ